MTNSRPVDSLANLSLIDGFDVVKRINPPVQATGGKFSVQYLVKKENKEYFLKAFDFSSALHTSDPMQTISIMSKAFVVERDILEKCKNRKLSKVSLPVSSGSIQVPGFVGLDALVYYLIFEKAKTDVRSQLSNINNIDMAWCFRSLHSAVTGIQQLHVSSVAHQDLKPSNILIYESEKEKISDLGRASDMMIASAIDDLSMPGDRGYAPLEQFYGIKYSSDFIKRFSIDMYHLGSLFFSYFLQMSATQSITLNLKRANNKTPLGKDFIHDLPLIINAFQDSMIALEVELSKYLSRTLTETISIINELCHPDPDKRGNPKTLMRSYGQFDLQRYISIFNKLARYAEMGWL